MIPSHGERLHGSKTIAAATCAKINLSLDVLGRRTDGFHELDSVVLGVGLHDELMLEWSCNSKPGLSCNVPELMSEENLVLRALRLVSESHPAGRGPAIPADGARGGSWGFRLEKRIPIGGGLGGGSGNAAGALTLLDRALNLGRTNAELAACGALLGSDVPLFFHLPAARIQGRGDRVARLPFAWSGWVLLVHAGGSVSTAAVYGAIRPDEYSAPPLSDVEAMGRLTRAEEIMIRCRNGLGPAIARVAPHVEAVRRTLCDRGIASMVISGAGSVLFRLFDEEEAARRTAERVTRLDPTLTTYVVPAPVGMQFSS